MSSLYEFFKENDFCIAAKILRTPPNNPRLTRRVPFFEFEPEFKIKGEKSTDCGWVYAWVGVSASAKNSPSVLYVGKAGQSQTLKKRCDQHRNGFSSSSAGRKNAEQIETLFEKNGGNYEIIVYARRSVMGEAFGIEGVSMCEFEEMALIKKFKNDRHSLWNFERKQK